MKKLSDRILQLYSLTVFLPTTIARTHISVWHRIEIGHLIDNNKVVFDGIFIQSAKIIIDNISNPTKELKMKEWLERKT